MTDVRWIEHNLVDALWSADAKAFYRLTTELADHEDTTFAVKTWWRRWRQHDQWIWDWA